MICEEAMSVTHCVMLIATMVHYGCLVSTEYSKNGFTYDDFEADNFTFTPDTTGCGRTFLSWQVKNGTISSPNYPMPYPNDIFCLFTFEGRGKERVQLRFLDFDLYYGEDTQQGPTSNYKCSTADTVLIQTYEAGSYKRLAKYCGRQSPQMLMSSGTQMKVIFVAQPHPDNVVAAASGFKAEFRFVTDYGVKSSGVQNEQMVCGFSFDSDVASNGSFSSPNHPGYYPRDIECHYLFYGKPNQRVKLSFPYFDVEGIPPQCGTDTRSDYVEISDYAVKDVKSSRYCGPRQKPDLGSTPTDTLISPRSFYRVTFKSNNVYDATGFSAYYQFITVKNQDTKKNHYDAVSSKAAKTMQNTVSSLLNLVAASIAVLFLL